MQLLDGKMAQFIDQMNVLMATNSDEAVILQQGGHYLAHLVAEDN